MIDTSRYSPLDHAVRDLLEKSQFDNVRVRRVMYARGYKIGDVDKSMSFVLLNMRGDAMKYMWGRCSIKHNRK